MAGNEQAAELSRQREDKREDVSVENENDESLLVEEQEEEEETATKKNDIAAAAEEEDTRSWPYPRLRRWLRFIVQYSLIAFLLLVLILWFGMIYERSQVRRGPNTLEFYQEPQVCALTVNETAITARTFPDEATARNESDIVAHCGACGACSTPHDVAIYDQTRNSLFGDSVNCAKRGLIGGYHGASECLSDRVGLSPGCNRCWVENIMCDLRSCIFTCFFHAMFQNGVHSGSDSEQLNACTLCDEIRCGPAFVACAGANRRRTGILSDIERDNKNEVCHKMDAKWWLDEDLQAQWEAEYGQAPDARGNRQLLRRRG